MIRVRYFASLRETMGRGEASFDLPLTIKTGRDLVHFLASQFPRAAEALTAPSLKIAIDQEIASFDAPLAGAKEVALLPPMTGG
jgi:sulfur-carrier protein